MFLLAKLDQVSIGWNICFFFYWRMPIHLFRLEINQMRNPLRHLRGTRPERQGRSRAMSGIIRMFVTSTAAGNKQKTNRAADGTHSVAEGLNRILQKNWTIGHRKNWNKTKERRFIFTSGDGRNRRRWPDFRSVSHLSKSTLDQPFRWPYCVSIPHFGPIIFRFASVSCGNLHLLLNSDTLLSRWTARNWKKYSFIVFLLLRRCQLAQHQSRNFHSNLSVVVCLN